MWCSCHVTATDVSGNARGMFVCGSSNPWQQNNEHKQRVDKQQRSVAVRLCLWLCVETCCTLGHQRFKDYIQRNLSSKMTRIYIRMSQQCKQNIKVLLLCREDEASVFKQLTTPDMVQKKEPLDIKMKMSLFSFL